MQNIFFDSHKRLMKILFKVIHTLELKLSDEEECVVGVGCNLKIKRKYRFHLTFPSYLCNDKTGRNFC